MKKNFLITTLTIILSSGVVRAVENNVGAVEYSCDSFAGEVLKIYSTSELDKKLIEYEDQNGQIAEEAEVSFDNSILYSKVIFKNLKNFGADAKLTLTESTFIGRGGCGRGSCDHNVMKQTNALLVKDEKEIYLYCN